MLFRERAKERERDPLTILGLAGRGNCFNTKGSVSKVVVNKAHSCTRYLVSDMNGIRQPISPEE